MDLSNELQNNIGVQMIVKEQSQHLKRGESLYAIKSKLFGVKFKRGRGVNKPHWIYLTNTRLKNMQQVVEIGKKLQKQTEVRL